MWKRERSRFQKGFLFAAGKIVVCLAALHFGADAALAQKLAPMTDKSAGLIPWAVAAGLGVAVLLPAFINPKRTHTKK